MLMRTLPIVALLLAAPAVADPVTLTPADPQPSAGDLSPGLAVSYAYPGEVRTLQAATSALKKSRSGPALRGLSYEDNNDGDLTLTSKKGKKVAAAITGYIRFDAPGTYTVDVISNDGVSASIGGQPVALYDGVHACEPAGEQEVVVPEAGWYDVDVTYFQRKGTACLIMDWNVGGEMGPVPDAAFAYAK
ncbi:MAG: PA14 domain-containing protein [Sulfitobacter sp.]